jgi:uncharacterized protein YeaO (DUF488 family)
LAQGIALAEIAEGWRGLTTVTLVCNAHDEAHSDTVALRNVFLGKREPRHD